MTMGRPLSLIPVLIAFISTTSFVAQTAATASSDLLASTATSTSKPKSKVDPRDLAEQESALDPPVDLIVPPEDVDEDDALAEVDGHGQQQGQQRKRKLVSCSPKQILLNGDFESGEVTPWFRYGSGNGHVLSIVEGGYNGSQYALKSSTRLTWYGLQQKVYMEECLNVADYVGIIGKFKLMQGDNTGTCKSNVLNSERCPKAYFHVKAEDGTTSKKRFGYVNDFFPDENGWYSMSGIYQLQNDYLNNQRVDMAFYDHRADQDIVIDDFKLFKIPFQCKQLILNPTFDNGDLSFWQPDEFTYTRIRKYSPGASGDPSDYALRSYGRTGDYRGATVFLDVRCMLPGLVYTITAKLKLVDSSGNPKGCNPSILDASNSAVCPTISVKGFGCPDGYGVGSRMWNEVPMDTWNANGYNDFKGTFRVNDLMGECRELYLVVGRDVDRSRDVIIDDFYAYGDEAASAIGEVTEEPTSFPSDSPSSLPSISPTLAPTDKPTSLPTVSSVVSCPDSGKMELQAGPVMLARSDSLCLLIKAEVAPDGSLSRIAPVARSHSGEPWSKYGGQYAEDLLYGWHFDNRDVGSQITLPELSGDEKYLLSSYSHSLSEKDSIARFLNTATYGVTADEIAAFPGPVTKESAAAWIQQQMDEPATSHRAFLRKRTNPRLTTPRTQFTPDHPCDKGSRWRSYTFSRKDGHQYWYRRKIGMKGDGPYVITLDGHARTTVDAFPWKRENTVHVFDQSLEYDISCWNFPEERVNGTWYIKTTNNMCEPVINPPIYFDDNTKLTLPNPVVPLPAVNEGLEEIDTHKIESKGQEFILVNGLDDEVCRRLPDIHWETEPPVFGQLPDGTWLQFDPRVDLEGNTVENPLPDGGGVKTIMTDDFTQCANVARSPFNEHGCRLSSEPTSCKGTANRATIKINLNADSLVAMHNITGKYVYAITNLPLGGDGNNTIDSVCEAGIKSRWEIKPIDECTATNLDEGTSESLRMLLEGSADTNAFVRDITFPHDESCNENVTEPLEEVSIIIGEQCFKRVHPHHMTIFDMTHCTSSENPCLLDLENGHPMKDLLDVHGNVFLDYPSQPNAFFDEELSKFTKVGRFGDTIKFRDLSNDLSLDEIAVYFGESSSEGGLGVVVCGSRDEVESDPSYGDVFDIFTGLDTPERKIVANRESVWTMIGLDAKDQLRQRIAWALAQLLVLVPDQIGSSGASHSEVFLHYYDIFVHNAFGNYRDILREVTYSPLMAENLSFLNSRSGGYNFENYGSFTFADENYAREIMQLFSVGLNLLNEDGTEKRDGNGNPILTYTNDEIMSMARVFTGFVRVSPRGNSEENWFGRNVMDHTTIEPAYRDKFPKHDLTGGYIGDGYPLCEDLPPKMFLRKGAQYKLLGQSPSPLAFEDHPDLKADPTTKHFILDANSLLRAKLCNPIAGNCQYDVVVTLDSNLDCVGLECIVDEPRMVQVENIFYEYIRPACVEQAFYQNPTRVTYINSNYHSSCANPKLAVASEACLTDRAKYTRLSIRYSNYVFDQERVKYDTARARCEADGLEQTWFHYIEDIPNYKKGYHWTNLPCEIKVKVNAFGLVSVVYDIPGVQVHSTANMESRNFFKVYWKNGDYPKNDLDGVGGNSCGNGACAPLDEGGCLCSTFTYESQVFSKMPPSAGEVFAKLYIGAYDPSAYDDGTYTVEDGPNLKAYHVDNEFSPNTIFEVTDSNGIVHLLKNSRESVRMTGSSFQFRNAPSFMSMLNEEASLRDANYEVEATLDHLVNHPNTAPFIATRLIQRFVTSNPTPDYVKAVATAFKSGKYDSFGSGKHGDLAATMSAILLHPDSLSAVLDVDFFHGSIREPLLKTMAFMRSMELKLLPEKKVLALDYPLKDKLGQMAHSFESVFSFFLPEHIPTGKPGVASLRSPESMLVDMPKITGLLNGLFSTIKYGLSSCKSGFGDSGSDSCFEGDFSDAIAKLNFERSSDDVEAVVSELSTLLTSGRLCPENKQTIMDAYTSKLPDQAAALRLAQQLMIATPEFHTTNTVQKSGESRVMGSNPERSGVPYKAVIFLMLQGGADSFNMLIPHTCSSKDMYKEYTDVRQGVAIKPKSLLLEINATSSNQICESFGMHPKLATAHQMYNDGDLLWFANAGVLTRPTDKSNYKKHTKTGLFAHNEMQREIQHIDPFKTDVETGVLGRMADVLLTQRQYSVERFNLYKRMEGLEGHHGADPFIIDASGIPKINEDPSSTSMRTTIRSLNEATTEESGVFADLFSHSLLGAFDANEELTSAISNSETSSTFGDDSLGRAFNMIARIIASREIRGVDRDFFFIPHSNWDAHGEVEWNLNVKNLPDLDSALNAFSSEMKSSGLWDSTTIVQASDFGRTLEPNGGSGTDHAWGGHYMMMGGSVKGGKILGKYPEILTSDGPDILERGRVVPSTSWDQIMATVAEWTGVSPESIHEVCPNIDKFPGASRFNAADLFDNI